MPKRAAMGVSCCLLSTLLTSAARGQDRASADEAIDGIRRLATISENDQRRIRDWVQILVTELADTGNDRREKVGKEFRRSFRDQSTNGQDTEAFRAEFAAQTTTIAAAQFGNPKVEPFVAIWVARVLLDLDREETLPGLLAGIKCPVVAARYLCARAMILQQNTIASNQSQLAQVVAALKAAGVAETSPVVLARLYRALAFETQPVAVFDAYLAVFDKRLAARREGQTSADGAEIEAYLFFRRDRVLSALNQDQKAQLVARLAVLLRLDAERYDNDALQFTEIDRLERLLEGGETIIKKVTNVTNGGDIIGILNSKGFDGRAQVPGEAYRWVGDAGTGTSGALNSTPWNVPVGAP